MRRPGRRRRLPRTLRRTGWALFAAGHLALLAAGFFAPYDYAHQHRAFPWAPPMAPQWVDSDGSLHLRPFVYPLVPDADGGYREDRSRRLPLAFFVRGDPYRLLGLVPTDRHLVGFAGGEAEQPLFLLGSDGFGRCVFSRLLWGGRVSLAAGWLATLLALGLGTAVGALAGLSGGAVDAAAMRGAELFLVLPWLYLLLAVRAFLPLALPAPAAFLLVVAVVGLLGWARPARLVRGVLLAERRREHVLAARGFGAGGGHLLRRHLLPAARGVVATQAALLVPRFVLAEVTLSFLGLGISAPVPSWGSLLAELQSYHVLVSYGWMTGPAVALAATGLGYQLLARGGPAERW